MIEHKISENDQRTNNRLIFRRNEAEKSGAMILVKDHTEAISWNEKGYGIFWAVNGFRENSIEPTGKGRTIENVTHIYSWAMECDDCSADEQNKRVQLLGIKPSLVVRSKRSFHFYWNAKNAKVENYKEITSMLQKLLGGDKAVTHAAATLRCPFYHHWKDPKNPFYCTIEFESEDVYDEAHFMQILQARVKETFGEKPKAPSVQLTPRNTIKKTFEEAGDQKPILQRLSGATELNGDRIEFRRVGKGNENILVNGQSSEAFLDSRGLIGSSKGGGPTALQWIMFYGYSKERAREILEKYNV